jgi:D-tyrosyl-tRNA(Tyr) deacylase
MRVLLQRVSRASVDLDGGPFRAIGRGLLVFLAIANGDTEDDARYLVDKTVNLRVFPNQQGRFDRSALDERAELLIVSQFTLYADTRAGRRPSFTASAPPDAARPLYERAVDLFRASSLRVETGQFQGRMQISLVNDGPVTILLDSADRHMPRRQT